MVLPVCPLVKADPGFECKGDPAVDPSLVDIRRIPETVLGRIIQVFKDLPHDIFPVVAPLVKGLFVFGVNRLVIPRHRPEGLDLAEVEPCPPEAANPFIVVKDSFRGRRLPKVLQEIVDIVEHRPVAAAPPALLISIPVPDVEVVDIDFGDILRILVPIGKRRGRRGIAVQETVGVGRQRGFRREILVGDNLVWNLVPTEETLAGNDGGKDYRKRCKDKYTFHNPCF